MISSCHYLLRVVKSGVKCLKKLKLTFMLAARNCLPAVFCVCVCMGFHLFTFGVERILMSARADARMHDEKLFWLIELGVLCAVFTGNGI